MSRLHGRRPGDLDEPARQLREHILSGPRSGTAPLTAPSGALLGPFDVLLHAPQVGSAVADLGAAVRFGTTIDRALVELAIVRVAAHWSSPFEAAVHRRLAVDAGVDEQVVVDILGGREPAGLAVDQRLVLDVVARLLDDGRLPDDLYDRAVGRFRESGTVELVTLVGYYSLVSMLLNAFEVGEDGLPGGG